MSKLLKYIPAKKTNKQKTRTKNKCDSLWEKGALHSNKKN